MKPLTKGPQVKLGSVTIVSVILAVVLGTASCGQIKASGSIRAVRVTAEDGARCYALIQNDEVKGGNCL